MPKQTHLTVRNLDAIVANFHATDREVQGEFKDLAEKYAALMENEIRVKLPTGPSAEHPYAEGFRRETLRTEFSSTGLVFDTGWFEEDFSNEPSGRGIFYPPYPEFGTASQPPQPTLEPAADRINPLYSADIRSTLRRIMQRHSG